MAAIRPVIFSESFEEEFQANRPVTEDTVKKLIQNANMLRALQPIAMVKAYQINMPGAKIPSSALYQYCDGAEIADFNSPLNGQGSQTTPDMTGRFLRGGFSTDTLGTEAGGSKQIDLTHQHATSNYFNPNELEEGDQRRGGEPNHSHGTEPDLGVRALDPKHMQIAFYLKVNV